MSPPLRRIGIERIELVLESIPAGEPRLLAGELEAALAARLSGVPARTAAWPTPSPRSSPTP